MTSGEGQGFVGPEGAYEISLPLEWEASYDEEGIPEFRDPRKNIGPLRVKTYLLKGPSAASLDSRDFLKESYRKMPGSDWVRLGAKNAIHSVDRSSSAEFHHWIIAEGPNVLLATYSLSDTAAPGQDRSNELALVVSILESLRFR